MRRRRTSPRPSRPGASCRRHRPHAKALELGANRLREGGIDNVLLQEGDAEQCPSSIGPSISSLPAAAAPLRRSAPARSRRYPGSRHDGRVVCWTWLRVCQRSVGPLQSDGALSTRHTSAWFLEDRAAAGMLPGERGEFSLMVRRTPCAFPSTSLSPSSPTVRPCSRCCEMSSPAALLRARPRRRGRNLRRVLHALCRARPNRHVNGGMRRGLDGYRATRVTAPEQSYASKGSQDGHDDRGLMTKNPATLDVEASARSRPPKR